MDRKERLDDLLVSVKLALQGLQSGLWTACPGIVQTVDVNKMTVTVRPAIQAKVRAPNGTISDVSLPLLLDVPIVFQHGGQFLLTFPVRPTDECLVIFSARCIDAHWQSGGVQPQAELRMHDLSDGFAIIGHFSQPTAASVAGGADPNSAQLRSFDGNTVIEAGVEEVRMTPDAGETMIKLTPGTILILADEVISHARNKNVRDAGGVGDIYEGGELPEHIDDYTEGVPVTPHPPTPPAVPT